MLNLALISSAGAYIDGTDPFDLDLRDGDVDFREIPIEVDADDLRYAAKGYDPAAVISDRNSQIPIERLLEYEANAVIGSLNNVWWSISSYVPNARRVAEEIAPKIANRLSSYNVQAALAHSCFAALPSNAGDRGQGHRTIRHSDNNVIGRS